MERGEEPMPLRDEVKAVAKLHAEGLRFLLGIGKMHYRPLSSSSKQSRSKIWAFDPKWLLKSDTKRVRE